MKTVMQSKLSLLIVSAAIGLAGCSTSTEIISTGPGEVPEIRPGLLQGYLPLESLPNSLALIPAPPQANTAAFAMDQEVASSSLAQRESPRWDVAVLDADLSFPAAAATFSCALKMPITEEQTPYLYQLLRRTLTDAGLSTYTAKDHYARPRPFTVNHAPICTPEEREFLENDGSYPSGHTAIGWAWALVLAELAPEQSDAIFARGLAYGESRNICNVHWRSDVIQGRLMAAATIARLHANADFRSDLEAASAEVDAMQAQGLTPSRDCAAEAAALRKKK